MNPTGILTNSSQILLLLLLPLLLVLQKLVHLVSNGMLLMVSPNDSETHLPPESPSKKEEFKEKDSSNLVNPLSSKSYPSPSSSSEKVYMPLPPFPRRLKKKDQAHV